MITPEGPQLDLDEMARLTQPDKPDAGSPEDKQARSFLLSPFAKGGDPLPLRLKAFLEHRGEQVPTVAFTELMSSVLRIGYRSTPGGGRGA